MTQEGRHSDIEARASLHDPTSMPPLQLSGLNAAGRAIAGADGLEPLLAAVTEAARALIGVELAVASRHLDGEGDAPRTTQAAAVAGGGRHDARIAHPPEVLGIVIEENRPLRLTADDLDGIRAAGGDDGGLGLPDYLAAPLISRTGRNMGLVWASTRTDGSKFTEEDEALLVQLAQMASATLEHVEVLERERKVRQQLEEHTREARLAAAVALAFTADAPLADKLDRCAQAVVDHLDAAFARVWTLDAGDDTLVLQASAGLYTHLDGGHARVPVGAYKIGLIAAELEPHLTNDVANDPRISDPGWAAREGMVAFAGYPLLLEGRCIGVLACFARRRLPASTIEALAAVADVVAVGIEQSRATDTLRLRAGQMRDLARAAAQINAGNGLEAILAVVTEQARAIIGAHQSISSLTRGPDWSQAVTAVSMSERYADWHGYDDPPDGSGIYAYVCERQQPMRMTQDELEAHPRWRGFGPAADAHPPMRGWLAAPLTAPDGSNLGLLQLSDKDQGEFTDEDLAILVQLAEIASSAIHKTLLFDDRARVATALQRSLLPPSLPQIPGVGVGARYRAGTEVVGGDFYDVFALRGSAWGVVIGDVRGKGPDAAALTALARHSTRAAAMFHRRPHRILAAMNAALLDDDEPERFCSAVFIRLMPAKGQVRFEVASGGHPPLLVARRGGAVEAIQPTGPLIGLFPDIKLTTTSGTLAEGDLLIAYTDGITEARRGGELFGQTRLTELVRACAGQDAQTTADAVIEAAGEFDDSGESDDAAALVIRAGGRT